MKACQVNLTEAPIHTGLRAVLAENTIPAGQYGKYECVDEDLGVERGESRYYNILCMGHGEYAYPPGRDYWPVCRSRTTTTSPGNLLMK